MQNWSEARNILCIRLDAMGDLLMSTPAIKSLKENRKGRRITLLTSLEGARIAPSIGLFDEIITYQAPWLKASGVVTNSQADMAMIELLKEKHFDAAVIFTVYSQNPLPSALLCYLSNIPLRASYCRENPYSLLTDWIKEDEPHKVIRHEVRRHLDLVTSLGCSGEDTPLVLSVDQKFNESLLGKLKSFGVCQRDEEEWVIIHPGSTASSRRFHTDGFSQVSEKLINEGKKIFFTGTMSEVSIVDDIQNKITTKDKGFSLAGCLELEEMLALLKMADLLISNNSGPVHMAAALGTPVVDIYALTNPQHTPWMVKSSVLFHEVSCAYCYKSTCPLSHNDCINQVSAQKIFEETLHLLSLPDSSGPDYSAVHPILFKGEVIL